MLNIVLQVLLQLSLCLQVFGVRILTYVCRGVHQCFHLFHLCLVYFTAIYLTFLFSAHSLAFIFVIYIMFSFSAFTHQQEPTLLSYRQKGAIPSPVVGRNPYYSPNVYLKLNHGSLMIIVLYVDDLLITGSSKKDIASLKDAMNHAFSMTDLVLLSQFLGLEIAQSQHGIKVRQSKYA